MLVLVIQAVLFEGWMLGFKPLPVEVVKEVDPQVTTQRNFFRHLSFKLLTHSIDSCHLVIICEATVHSLVLCHS